MVPGEGRKRPSAGSSALMRTSMAWPRRSMSSWVKLSGSPLRHPDLLAHEVDARHELGDRVLHLEPGVHLEEPELAVLVEELDGAGVVVAARLGDLHGGLAHGLARLGREGRRRALLDQLLVAPLGRAVALADPHDVAVGVADDLHLDVARPGEVALDVALVAAEALERLGLRRLEGGVGLVGALHDAHAATAAAVGRLDGDRPAELLAEGDDLVAAGEELGGAGHARHAGLLGGDAARHLVAHHLDGLGRRADEGHAPLGDGPGEVGVLGEEPVARVHAVGPGLVDHLEDPLGVEVALGGGLAPEGVGLVGEAHVQRLPVELGVHRHRGDAHLLAGADDADGDLAPVGDEDLGEHAIWLLACRAERARSALAGGPGARFADVRWVAETGSTNADAMELARQGEREGIVLVADHQTAGRGRAGRTWTAPPGAGLLLSVLLRPPAPVRRPRHHGGRASPPPRRSSPSPGSRPA